MANGLPEYQPREQVGASSSPLHTFQPASMPQTPDLSVVGKAVSGLGQEMQQVVTKLQEGQQHTLASQGMEQFLTENAALRQQHVESQDYQNAEKDYTDQIAQSQRNALENITDPKLRAATSLQMTRVALSSQNDVRTAQLGHERDINLSGNDTLTQTSLNDAATAKSPQERQAAIDRVQADLERLHSAGWIDGQTAVARFKSFGSQLDQADAMKLGQDNPAGLAKALDDPKMFASLDPVRRESLKIAAQSKMDGNAQAWAVQSARFHQEAASLAVGTLVSPEHGQKLFDNGIVKVEGARDNTEVSNKGAIGYSQILPGTARDMAKATGRNDIAALSEPDLVAKLKSDPQLNHDLGLAYWQQMLKRYDGNATLAAAAYNAGPGRADAWRDKAGPNASPQDIADVIDIKETRDYVNRFFGLYGAPMGVKFSSPAATLQAATAVGSVLDQQQARENHLLAAQAKATVSTDPIAKLVEDGYSVDPMRIANQRAILTASAARGDQTAASSLRDLDFAEKTQPFIKQAWSTPPAILDQQIKSMEAELSRPGAQATETGANVVKAFKAVAAAQQKARDSEPVMLGAKAGLYSLQPIDPSGAPDDTMVGALRARDAQAKIAHGQWGGSGSPFTAQEAEAWHQRYADASPQDRTALLGTLAQGLSPQTFAAALPQVVSGSNAKNDRPAVTMAAGLYGAAPEVAGSILQGIDAQKTDEKYVPVGTSRQTYDASRATYLPAGAFNVASRTDPRGSYASMQDAIDARYAFLSAQAKDSSGNLNSSRLQQAVTDVTGGVLQHNGAGVIAPARGMTQAAFDGVLLGLSDADLAGAQTTSGKSITADYLRGSTKLQAVADGRYLVQINRDDGNPQYAAGFDGKPFVLDLRGRKASPLPASPGPSFESLAAP